MMGVHLFEHQIEALDELVNGSILHGGVGSGKSITSIAYYLREICGVPLQEDGDIVNPDGTIALMEHQIDLYIITTARKRDTGEWESELNKYLLSENPKNNFYRTKIVVDSWNNIEKYTDIKDQFFIFDEQRTVGYGTWSKSMVKISKKNKWIMLTATPGDTWMDYMTVFIANGFYKNKTDFVRQHVVYSPFTKFPKVSRYISTQKLYRLRDQILVDMDYKKHTVPHKVVCKCEYDNDKYKKVDDQRWNVFKSRPVKNRPELMSVIRRVVNSDSSRLDILKKVFDKRKKVIVFYNFDYELYALRAFAKENKIPRGEWNGHKKTEIPDTDEWLYLVQYTSGNEGWNCTKTDTILFYSLNYSYRVTKQSCGRIDRLNTKYIDLYYYFLVSDSKIDKMISKALKNKKNFTESDYIGDF